MVDSLDIDKLELEVKNVYRAVATAPSSDYHFEMGRDLAEQLGYPTADLDRIPQAALESFAGVGYHFDLAAIVEGDDVLDLGSGSGTDVFIASLYAGATGSVIGIDMTEEQLDKARQNCEEGAFENVTCHHGYIEELPFNEDSFDVVISNGVINLSASKERVFAEMSRVLRPSGRLAVADIISEVEMPESIKTDADLWAACIGGAMQIDRYTELVESCGFKITEIRENSAYQFLSDQAANACKKYGVKSISFGARLK